ncbi:hypothetical protein HDV05_001852 [Chytridiales sp. JEL 0842]|nr:hypothetical protein HDV05_001852 [Chytridiales sp. JEL 0842]
MMFDIRKYDNHIRRIDPGFREADDVWVEEHGKRVKLDGWDKFAERTYDYLAMEEHRTVNTTTYYGNLYRRNTYTNNRAIDYDLDDLEDPENEFDFGGDGGDDMEFDPESFVGTSETPVNAKEAGKDIWGPPKFGQDTGDAGNESLESGDGDDDEETEDDGGEILESVDLEGAILDNEVLDGSGAGGDRTSGTKKMRLGTTAALKEVKTKTAKNQGALSAKKVWKVGS